MKKIVIFGVGLIGGSVALALKSNKSILNAKNPAITMQIVGVGRAEKNLKNALDLGVIDSAESDVKTAIEDAEVILIATPVAQTTIVLKSIKPHLNNQTVITDAGSTKSDVLMSAKAILGSKFNQFVGGHPIAGAEKSGVLAADSSLFAGKNVVLTPTVDTNADAIAKVTQLWQACGANVCEMTAQKHDEIFAAVSHLPHLLAFALVDEVASRPNAAQLFSYAASGFRDFTRIAGSHPEMWRDISLANKVALLDELNAYQNKLNAIKQLLENEDGQALEALFERASMARNNWANQHK